MFRLTVVFGVCLSCSLIARADDSVKVFGYGQTQFLSMSGREFKAQTGRTDNLSTFEANRVHLGAWQQKNLKESTDLTWKISLDAGQSEYARFSQALDPSWDRIVLNDAYFTVTFNDQFSITGGQQKVPFSTEIIRPSNERLAPERAHINTSTLGYYGRDIGVLFTYRPESNNDLQWDLNLGIFNGNGINQADNNNAKDFLFSVGKEHGPCGARASYLTGDFENPNGTKHKRDRWSIDGHYNQPNWGIEGQWAQGDGSYYYNTGLGGLAVDRADVKGGYLQAYYALPNQKTKLFYRYQYFDANEPTYRERIQGNMFGISHACSPSLSIMAALEHLNEKNTPGDTYIGTLRTTFSF